MVEALRGEGRAEELIWFVILGRGEAARPE
jgi:hypothetical protein